MYVCLCNGLTDRDLRAHQGGKGCSVAMVYRALGAEPQCGKCVKFVRQMLRQSEDSVLSCRPAACRSAGAIA